MNPKQKSKSKLAKSKITLEKIITAAHEAGVKVSCSLENIRMPMRLPNDPEPVRILLDESERVSKLGNNWMSGRIPNPIAADKVYQMGWAYALAAAHLRAKLSGELDKLKK